MELGILDIGTLATTPLPTQCDCSGSNAIPYYNMNTDCTLPKIWIEHKNTKGDLNWTDNADKNENTPRGKGICYKTYSPGKGDLEVSLDIGCDIQYEGNNLIESMRKCGASQSREWAFLTRCILDVGASGISGCFNVFNLGTNNPQSGDTTKSVTFAPAAPCSGCSCPVQKVIVTTAGEIGTFVPGSLNRALSLSPKVLAFRENRVIGLEGALALTIAEKVNVEVDDLLVIMQAMGKSVEQIQADFASISEHHKLVIFQKESKPSALWEFNREGLIALLQDVNAQARAI